MRLRHWWFVLPSITLLAAPACGGDDGGAETGSTGTNATTGTTDDGASGTTTGEPDPGTGTSITSDDPTEAPTSTPPTGTGTTDPGTTSEGTTGTTDPGTTSDGTTGTTDPGTGTTDDTTTGGVEPGPEHIPEIPDDGMPSSAHFKKVPLGMSDAEQGYWEYTPPGYGGGEAYPLLVFLHGIGENGDGDGDLDKVPNNGPPKMIKNDQWDTTYPFVVLSPQHPGGGCPGAGEVHSFIDFAMTHYDINPARVYLTGLSCGGIGAWGYLGEFLDEQIAAMVPIAGDGKGAFNKAMCELGRVPIWAFHGDADGTVNVSGTTEPVTKLQMCDPKPDVDMVIYPDVGHDSWTMTYNLSAGHDIYAWMLERYKQ